MPRVLLVHWHAGEAAGRLAALRAAGFDAAAGPHDGPALWRRIREAPFDALVVDLGRLPAHGLQVALMVRERKATRRIPLVFAGGEPAKVERIRRLLPDATYASWRGIRGALCRALARPPRDPVVAGDRMAGYSGTPLPRKLGIRPGSVVVLIGAPEGFAATLGELPEGAVLRPAGRGRGDLTIAFVRSRRELAWRMPAIARRAAEAPVWIAWPKKAGPIGSDLGQPVVREAGLAAGLVDYKICAINAAWSGLLFRKRR